MQAIIIYYFKNISSYILVLIYIYISLFELIFFNFNFSLTIISYILNQFI